MPHDSLSTLSIPDVETGDSGIYSCEISNACGTVTTNNAILNVAVPEIIREPADEHLCIGSGNSVQFTIQAVVPGSTPTYQWQLFNGAGWSNMADVAGHNAGVTTTVLTVSSLDSTDNGNLYQCIVTSALCPKQKDTSDDVTLQVSKNYLPVIQQNRKILKCAADKVVLTTTDKYQHYDWSNHDTTATITVNKKGTFTVSVSDNNGCSGTSPSYAVSTQCPYRVYAWLQLIQPLKEIRLFGKEFPD